MPTTIEYRSSRKEVWSWYWRTWRQSLWKFHLLIFLAFAGGCYAASDSVILSVVVALVPVSLLPLYPQLRFKSELRTLTAGEDGIDTTIGRKHCKVPWIDVAIVKEDDAGRLFIQRKNGNAFIIPPRAFDSDAERTAFGDLIRHYTSPDSADSAA